MDRLELAIYECEGCQKRFTAPNTLNESIETSCPHCGEDVSLGLDECNDSLETGYDGYRLYLELPSSTDVAGAIEDTIALIGIDSANISKWKDKGMVIKAAHKLTDSQLSKLNRFLVDTGYNKSDATYITSAIKDSR